ncbi:hypothetical protein [Rhizobium sp.]|uniref:hypothetical protein n=1 Tax=Rhizobium sp. TaxID=391 RepID=UPI0028AA89FC
MSRLTIYWKTVWSNGDPTHVVQVPGATISEVRDIESFAKAEGYNIADDGWKPTETSRLSSLFEVMQAKGYDLKFEPENPDAPFNLERLSLLPRTRDEMERLPNFILQELAGYCPVQAEGEVDGQFFYFRARGSHWRIDIGGNETGTKGPKWWHAEEWPGDTGFEAGYLSDEDAIGCILKSVSIFRTGDRDRFRKGHPEYERTILEGWAIGALSLQRASRRLSMTGRQAMERAKAYGIELPYYADQELRALDAKPSPVLGLDKATVEWRELRDEDE